MDRIKGKSKNHKSKAKITGSRLNTFYSTHASVDIGHPAFYCRDKATMVEIAVPMLASKTVTSKPKHPARVLPRIGANIAQFLFNVAQPLIDLRLDGF